MPPSPLSSATGVRTLSPTNATLLVFVDQTSIRKKDKQSSVSAAQLSVTAEAKGRS